MKKVFIIHGFRGAPNGSWKSWLMWELGKKDIYACALPMPSPDNPKKDEWIKVIKEAVSILNEEIFLVGHSLGVPAILHYLETLNDNEKIGGAVLVSGPITILNSENKDSKLRKIDNFLDTPFDFNYIKQKSKKFSIIHGDNDDKVPLGHAKIFADKFDCKLVIIPGGGHLSSSSGCYQLPEAPKALQDMLK